MEDKNVTTIDEVLDAWLHGKKVCKVTFQDGGTTTYKCLRKGDAVYDVTAQGNFYYKITDYKYVIASTFSVDNGVVYVGYYEGGKTCFESKEEKANIFNTREEAEAVLSQLKMKDFLKVIEIQEEEREKCQKR